MNCHITVGTTTYLINILLINRYTEREILDISKYMYKVINSTRIYISRDTFIDGEIPNVVPLLENLEDRLFLFTNYIQN